MSTLKPGQFKRPATKVQPGKEKDTELKSMSANQFDEAIKQELGDFIENDGPAVQGTKAQQIAAEKLRQQAEHKKRVAAMKKKKAIGTTKGPSRFAAMKKDSQQNSAFFLNAL